MALMDLSASWPRTTPKKQRAAPMPIDIERCAMSSGSLMGVVVMISLDLKAMAGALSSLDGRKKRNLVPILQDVAAVLVFDSDSDKG